MDVRLPLSRQRVAVGCIALAIAGLWSRPTLAIGEGHLAQTCQYPSIVLLDGTRGLYKRCSGAYVGGRVIVTAAHCFEAGFAMNRLVFEADTGTSSPICETDSDCPIVTILGQPTQLLCETELFGGSSHAEKGECYYPDREITNYVVHAKFGEAYEPFGQEHPTRSVPISYCHINPAYLEAPAVEAYDFAYCILAEEPDVQPLPIMMHCEVDAFMTGEQALDVRAVGFGVAGHQSNWTPHKSGRKRWASSSTASVSLTSAHVEISLGLFSSFDPGPPLDGDSGSPLLVKLPPPHDTWHILGVMVKPFHAVAPWHYMEWMHENPEVVASKILPCHELDGSWTPSAACGGFPLTPGDPVGDWAFGPTACHNENVSGWSSTCGAPFSGSPLPGPGDDVAAPPRPSGPDHDPGSVSAGREPVGCSVGAPRSGLGLVLLGLTLVALRRRRSGSVGASAIVLCSIVVTGCPDDSIGNDFGGDTGGAEPEPQPVEMHPSLRKTHTGLQLDGTGYQQLAVGNVARPIGDPSCCQDVVLGGLMSPDVELFFGGGSTERGLTFLDARPTQVYAMAAPGDGIEDLALADLNGDGRNDLLAVTTGGHLGVRLGVASDTPLGELSSFAIGGGKQLGRLAVGDLDCDGDPDVAATAPSSGGLIIARQSNSGAFGAGVFVATVPAEGKAKGGNPQDVAIGDLDGTGALDLVSMNDDGTVTTFLRGECGSGLSVVSKTVYPDVGNCLPQLNTCLQNTIGSHVLTDDVFCGTALGDVTVAFADRVLTYCNGGDINAAIKLGAFADHRWDVNGTGKPSLVRIRDIHWWPDPATLHVLAGRYILRLTDPGTDFNGHFIVRVLGLIARGHPVELEMIRHADDGVPDWWQRVVWVSSEGELGFAR
jgi:hypothetical protein